MGGIRRLAVLGASAVMAGSLALASGASAEVHHQRVGPDQDFTGLVNGSTGATGPVVIRMACFGPIVPGQKGHPLPGQTVEVLEVPPPPTVPASDLGRTGPYASSIGAFFGVLPPGATSTGSLSVSFTYYGKVKKIPTSMELPCSGTSQVTFLSIPLVGGTSASVPVTYVGQP